MLFPCVLGWVCNYRVSFMPGKSRNKGKSSKRKSLPLQVYLVRVKRKRLIVTCMCVIALLVLIVADRQGFLLSPGGDLAQYHGQAFRVVRIVDGDTLIIDAQDGESATTRVRLWGIDTPELANVKSGTTAQLYSDEAAQFARDLCEGKVIVLSLESHRLRDYYGRLLAYVELPDGRVLNEQLLKEGLAKADDFYPHRWRD